MYVCYVCMPVWCNGCWLKVPDGLVAKATPNEVLQGLDFTTFVCVCVCLMDSQVANTSVWEERGSLGVSG